MNTDWIFYDIEKLLLIFLDMTKTYVLVGIFNMKYLKRYLYYIVKWKRQDIKPYKWNNLTSGNLIFIYSGCI